MPTKLDQVRKFLVALATTVVELGALWADAPDWVIVAVGVAGAILTYLVPNEPMPESR